MNTQEISLLAFLLERIRDEDTLDPPASFRIGDRGVALFDVNFGIEKRSRTVLDVFLILLRSISQAVPARAVDDADVPVRQACFALCFGFNIE